MHFSSLLAALLAAPLATGIVIVGQANFYYDDSCKDYAGSSYPSPTEVSGYPLGNVKGGPAGSKSMLWVYGELSNNNCMGPYFFACKNAQCSAANGLVQGQCKSFTNGIWAAYQEDCPS